MPKVTIQKNVSSCFHDKMIVLPNESCAQFIKGLTANDYV